ncbi:MAG: M23 family metallopeptidase [Bacteroidota bacterium]
MRREKFVFNQESLQYDRIVEPLRYTILRIAAFCCAVGLTALLMMFIVHRYLPSPSERLLMQENDILRGQIEGVGQELAELSSVLDNIQERDAAAHRMIFRMDPIDKGVWQGGRGGHDVYEDLRALPNSGDKMADLREEIDRFKYQLDLQSRSLDSITVMAEKKEERLASIPSIKPIRSDRYSRKIENLSGFGYRIHPVYKVKKFHYGIDFNCKKGTPIQATGKGKVTFAGKRGHYGNCVIIDHGFGYESLYGHMDSIDPAIKKGKVVERGVLVGKVGSTGLSTGDHLHYEVRKDGVRVDPIQYCYDGLSPEEYAELVLASQQLNQSFGRH